MKKLEITLMADTNLTRELGLMCKKPLKKNECALFNFEKKGRYSFWNKNVSFPISLIFCDENLVVKDINYLKEFQLNSIASKTNDIKYVVEAHNIIPEEWGIKIGNKLRLDNLEIIYG